MFLKIDQDYNRFKQIIRGKIKQELKKFITQGELIGKEKKGVVSVPLPQIEIPHFTFGPRQSGGVGQGEGKAGDVIGVEEVEGEGLERKAGDKPGDHIQEVDVSLDEMADIMSEELALPDIQSKGHHNLMGEKERYTSISQQGPESLRHFKRTYKQALKRQIITGTYDPKSPLVVPTREDRRYRSWKDVKKPERNAVVIYMMDVSGSMGNEQKEIVRVESFWIDTWLRSHYKGLETRYIVHDAIAREVDQETFYHTRESGGTIISSAYRLCLEIMSRHYPSDEWNIYPFHFSDGDNWSGNDTVECLRLLDLEILPRVNSFSYGQVESEYGSGQFLKDLSERFKEDKRMALSKIPSKEAIYDSIKTFLGKRP